MQKKRRTERYTKRLEADFSASGRTHKGFLSDVSETGLFIRTSRSFREGSPIDIKIFLPDGKTSSVKGVVRRAITNQEGMLAKNGMGVELTAKDENFMALVRGIEGEEEGKKSARKKAEVKETKKAEDKVVLQCAVCGAKNAVPRDRLGLGPRCGACKSPLEFGSDFHKTREEEEKRADQPVVIECPSCGAKNKVPASKLHLGPKCGACKKPLKPASENADPKPEPPKEEPKQETEFLIIACAGCGAKNKVPRAKLPMGPKCGNCKAPLRTE